MSPKYTVLNARDFFELEKEIENFKQDHNILEVRYFMRKLRHMSPVYSALIKY